MQRLLGARAEARSHSQGDQARLPRARQEVPSGSQPVDRCCRGVPTAHSGEGSPCTPPHRAPTRPILDLASSPSPCLQPLHRPLHHAVSSASAPSSGPQPFRLSATALPVTRPGQPNTPTPTPTHARPCLTRRRRSSSSPTARRPPLGRPPGHSPPRSKWSLGNRNPNPNPNPNPNQATRRRRSSR